MENRNVQKDLFSLEWTRSASDGDFNEKKPIILVLILWSFINVSSEEIFKDVILF